MPPKHAAGTAGAATDRPRHARYEHDTAWLLPNTQCATLLRAGLTGALDVERGGDGEQAHEADLAALDAVGDGGDGQPRQEHKLKGDDPPGESAREREAL